MSCCGNLVLCLVLGGFGPLDRIVLFISEAFTALENWNFCCVLLSRKLLNLERAGVVTWQRIAGELQVCVVSSKGHHNILYLCWRSCAQVDLPLCRTTM